MESIEQMIKRLCPKGVEWKKISEICVNICSGGTPPRDKSDYFIGNIPWLRTQEVNWTDIYDTELKISEEAVYNSSAKLIPSNCVIVAMYGATAAKACINKIELTTNQACCNLQIDSGKALYKYVYYWICNNYIKLKCLGEGSQNNLNAKKIKEYPIPIPPLEIQSRIVEVLDKMTTLTSELEAELKAELETRKQQYEYYRNKLLTFSEIGEGNRQVTWKKISEICVKVYSGRNKSKTEQGLYPVYGSTGIIGMCESPVYNKRQILVARVGANAGFVHLADGSYDVSDNTIIIDLSKEVNQKFVFYMLRNANLNKFAKGGGQPLLTATQIKDFVIPVPSMQEQQRIVSILDRFETLTTDLQSGLPAEIEARRQQYEYYRNKLLTFDAV
ncbi:MAG: restriction endonuclease subunit S [Prevotella sp.]|nr:restriction endonuclease subunit S [Bacteroidales bacterium]MDY5877577.1 restriction endonuclease subunit S [Prevotella sp.]